MIKIFKNTNFWLNQFRCTMVKIFCPLVIIFSMSEKKLINRLFKLGPKINDIVIFCSNLIKNEDMKELKKYFTKKTNIKRNISS